ncbi:5730_t:CDS:2, partial [Cetraspora pellucida]
ATFKGIPFSSTSTYPRKNLYMSSIQSKFKLELNDKQKKIMEGISNVVFNQPFDDFCESISFGMPPSSSMEVDGSKEMGFTPDIDI